MSTQPFETDSSSLVSIIIVISKLLPQSKLRGSYPFSAPYDSKAKTFWLFRFWCSFWYWEVFSDIYTQSCRLQSCSIDQLKGKIGIFWDHKKWHLKSNGKQKLVIEQSFPKHTWILFILAPQRAANLWAIKIWKFSMGKGFFIFQSQNTTILLQTEGVVGSQSSST